MKYLLTSLNQTNERSAAIKDYIQMAFKIDPREIRYDNLPSIVKLVTNLSEDDRQIAIKERVINVIETIERQMNTKINLDSLTKTYDYVEVSVTVNEEKLKFRL